MTPAEREHSDFEEIKIGLAQINGKIDVLATQFTAEREARKDHEARIRALEARPTISPKQLASTLALAVGALGALWAFISDLIPTITKGAP